jgi:hypothetical protein
MDVTMLFNEWLKDHPEEEDVKSLLVSDVTYGLATNIDIMCTMCKTDNRYTKHRAAISPEKTTNFAATGSDLCQYAINLKFCFALQSMGIGGEHALILTAFLDLPDSHKWPRQFSVLEKFTHATLESMKCKTQGKATEEEVIATMDLPNDEVPQYVLEANNPMRQIQAFFDMGWQVRSSGGKYASPTEHALLIGALSKKSNGFCHLQ